MSLFTGEGLEGSSLFSSALLDLPIDADVATFFGILDGAGEAYLPGEETLMNNFVTSLKDSGAWDKGEFFWMPVGATVATATRCIKHPSGVGTILTNNGPFLDADWDRTLGLSGVGKSNAFYLDTLTVENDYDMRDCHLSVTSETVGLSIFSRDIGTTSADRFQVIVNFSSNKAFFRAPLPDTGVETADNGVSDGVFLGNKLDDLAELWRDSTLLGSATRGAAPATTAEPISIFRVNSNTSGKVLSSASAGLGFTTAERESYVAAIQATRTERALLV